MHALTQTVSVAKAGLISTLNARTSVCACANPIGSRYAPHLSIAENINLPPTLLTRCGAHTLGCQMDVHFVKACVLAVWVHGPAFFVAMGNGMQLVDGALKRGTA
eukprot:363427-Chlamydomonas_euryale.AAC.4